MWHYCAHPTLSLSLSLSSTQSEPDSWIAQGKTLDPDFTTATGIPAASLQLPPAFAYQGMPHPPPAAAGQDVTCGLPWAKPLLAGYGGAAARAIWGDTLTFTMCNW